MKYFVTHFALTAESMDIIAPATDILQSFLADIGYEAFQNDSDDAMTEALALLKTQNQKPETKNQKPETKNQKPKTPNPPLPFNCFSAYVQQSLFNEKSLKETIAAMPFEGLYIYYGTREAEDKNWNEQWEAEQEQSEICQRLGITIDVKQAFGTGGHFTTRMILEELMRSAECKVQDAECKVQSAESEHLTGKTVLDCGCGSGILSIAALKLGAAHATAYDIDEWSVRNTRHNAELNGISPEKTTVLEGDATVLNGLGDFDIVLANINRNILLNDMPAFAAHLKPGGRMILSGFYTEDAEQLTQKAQALSLSPTLQREDNNWCMLVFTRVG